MKLKNSKKRLTARSTHGAPSSLIPSLLSGFYASLSSTLAKLASSTTPHPVTNISYYILCLMLASAADCASPPTGSGSPDDVDEGWGRFEIVSGVVRVVCFAGVTAANGLMWGEFTRALAREETGSVRVAVVNGAANLGCTAFTGKLLFGEPLNSTWWLGAALVTAGTVLMGLDKKVAEEEKTVLKKRGS
ncbi:hypothetical protein HK101_010337 [Irineochytrium annulatum]|nr:hypothetical protein HK101_010337 [Irineochytrium annulatum]